MRIAAVFLYCLAVLPMKLRLRLRMASGVLPHGALWIGCGGFSFSLPLRRIGERFRAGAH